MFHFDEDFNLMFNTKLCASLQLKWGLGWRWGNFLPPSLPLSLRLFLVVSFHSEFESWFCWNKIFQKCSARNAGSPFHEVQKSPSLCELPHLGAGVLWLAKGPYFEISSISWLILGGASVTSVERHWWVHSCAVEEARGALLWDTNQKV